jgi:hypothetical protein
MSKETSPAPVVPYLYQLHLDKYLRQMGEPTVEQPVEVSVTIDKNGDGRVPCPVLIVSCPCQNLNATLCGKGVVVCRDCGRTYALDVRHEPERVVATISALPEYAPLSEALLSRSARQDQVEDTSKVMVEA